MRTALHVITECPSCGARYRPRPAQLQAAAGMVRCGRCGTAFDGVACRVETPGQSEAEREGTNRHTPPPRKRLGSGTFVLALRNLLRHRRRTALGATAVVFGVIALLLAGGFIEWAIWQLRQSTIESRLGHIQLVKPGYFEQGAADPYAYLVPEDPELLRAIRETPQVVALTPRLAFTGLASRGETTVSFLGEGVQPETEAKVSLQVSVIEGEGLSSQAPDGIILGKGLALNLGVKPGDTVVLLATTQAGGVSGVDARVRGIFQTSTKAFDDVALRVPIGLARQLVKAEGAHTWVILLDDTDHTDTVLAALRAAHPTERTGLEFVPWIDLADFYKKVSVLFTAQVDFVRLIIALIILVSISNMLGMAVLERTPEIGTLMALGVRRNAVLRLFLTEGLFLGLIGGVVGVAVGSALAALISYVGIPMPPAPGLDFSFIAEIRVTRFLAVSSLVLAIVATLLASLYPAWRASRLEIVDALRHAR